MKIVLPAGKILSVISFCLLAFGPEIARGQTSNECVSPLSSDFLSKYEVVEVVENLETNSAGPVLDGTNAYEFGAIIILATNLSGTASTAVLTIPGQAPTLMTPNGRTEFVVEAATNAFTNITSSYPDGTYMFTISGNTISVTLPAGSALPNAPALSDYAADQSIDPAKDFTLTWNPFITGGVLDFIGVSLTSESDGITVLKSGDFGCPGALNGTATSILIPSNTLASNTTYRATIDFIKAYTFDTNSIPGDALLAGTEADTDATISTGPNSVAAAAPVLTNAAVLSGGILRFDFTTTPGLTYTVQFNSNLNNPAGWSPLLTTDAVANLVPYTNSQPNGAAAGFYRVLQQ